MFSSFLLRDCVSHTLIVSIKCSRTAKCPGLTSASCQYVALHIVASVSWPVGCTTTTPANLVGPEIVVQVPGPGDAACSDRAMVHYYCSMSQARAPNIISSDSTHLAPTTTVLGRYLSIGAAGSTTADLSPVGLVHCAVGCRLVQVQDSTLVVVGSRGKGEQRESSQLDRGCHHWFHPGTTLAPLVPKGRTRL